MPGSSPGMTNVSRGAGIAPEVMRHQFRPKRRGRGECRALSAHPQPRVRKMKAHEQVTARSRNHPAFPHANGFNGFLRALPGESGFLATIAGGSSRQLDASVEASGPHDFAVRANIARLSTLPRPPHPAPNVRDDRETPLVKRRDAGDLRVFRAKREGKYFCGGGLDR